MQSPPPEAPASIFLDPFGQVCLSLCLFLSLVCGVPELSLFALMLLAAGLGARLWSRASLNGLDCTLTLDRERLFPGERLEIGLRVENAKWLPVLWRVDLFLPEAVSGTGGGQWVSEESGLLWFQRSVRVRELFPRRRGVYDLGPPRVRGGDLFGFFFRQRATTRCRELIVYPRIVGIREVDVPRRAFFGVPGTRSPVADPVFVFGTRDYRPGRPARGIHWKASARHDRLQEKLCEPAEHEKVMVLLDADGFEDEGAGEGFERTLEAIASLVLRLVRRKITVGFATNGPIAGGRPRVVPVSGSAFQAAAILETLARVGPENGGRPVTEVLAAAGAVSAGVSVVCFAHALSGRVRKTDRFMRDRNLPVRFVLAVRPEGGRAAAPAEKRVTLWLDEIRVPEEPEA